MAGKGIIRIYYKDSSYKSFYLHDDVTAKEVAELFGSDFLHVEKKVAAHFSIHVVIDGKDIRQLKPDDRPLKVQRDLFSLKISWNTDKNYFLFCLSDEAKMRMTAKIGNTSPFDLGSPQPLRTNETELIIPNKLSSQSTPERPSLTRKLTSLRPKLFFGKGKSEIKPSRPPLPSSLSESADLGASAKQYTTPPLERRSTTIGGSASNEPLSSKTKQEISENLRKMVMEEKQKLQSSSAHVSVMKAQSPVVLQRTITQSQVTAISSEDPVRQTLPHQRNEEEENLTQKNTEENQRNKQMEDLKKQLSPSPPPVTAKKDTEEISNMFDSIFDWYPAKTETPLTPDSDVCFESPSAAHSHINGESDETEAESFDQAFDDILSVLNKLRA